MNNEAHKTEQPPLSPKKGILKSNSFPYFGFSTNSSATTTPSDQKPAGAFISFSEWKKLDSNERKELRKLEAAWAKIQKTEGEITKLFALLRLSNLCKFVLNSETLLEASEEGILDKVWNDKVCSYAKAKAVVPDDFNFTYLPQQSLPIYKLAIGMYLGALMAPTCYTMGCESLDEKYIQYHQKLAKEYYQAAIEHGDFYALSFYSLDCIEIIRYSKEQDDVVNAIYDLCKCTLTATEYYGAPGLDILSRACIEIAGAIKKDPSLLGKINTSDTVNPYWRKLITTITEDRTVKESLTEHRQHSKFDYSISDLLAWFSVALLATAIQRVKAGEDLNEIHNGLLAGQIGPETWGWMALFSKTRNTPTGDEIESKRLQDLKETVQRKLDMPPEKVQLIFSKASVLQPQAIVFATQSSPSPEPHTNSYSLNLPLR